MERQPLPFFNQVAEVRKIPRDVIADVVVNDSLKDGSSTNVRRWLDQDFVIEGAGYFAFANSSSSYRPQSPTMHRALINELAHNKPFFDEFGNGYSSVASKGIGLSRYALNRRSSQGEGLQRKRERLLMHGEPDGFFGFRHARQDMYISNQMAKYGGRVSRGLAILVLDHANFRNWAQCQLGDSAYPCLEILDKVEANGDNAAILVRMFPSDRLDDLKYSKDFFEEAESQRRAATTLIAEISRRGINPFRQRFAFNEYFRFKVEPVVQKLEREAKSGNDFTALRFFRAYFNLWNMFVKYKVSNEEFDGTLTVQLSSQNIDALGTWCDFETGTKGDPQYYWEDILEVVTPPDRIEGFDTKPIFSRLEQKCRKIRIESSKVKILE